jgi:hypothetical protein
VLLRIAEDNGFDVLVTGDKRLHREQNMEGRKIAVFSLSAVNWPVIEPYVDIILAAVNAAEPGSFTRVDCGTFSRRRPRPPKPEPN